MEIIFLLISLIITITVFYRIGRSSYTLNELLRIYKTNEFLYILHLLLGTTLVILIFIVLCSFNNTFWHLPYLTR
jgi:hypothetical protein